MEPYTFVQITHQSFGEYLIDYLFNPLIIGLIFIGLITLLILRKQKVYKIVKKIDITLILLYLIIAIAQAYKIGGKLCPTEKLCSCDFKMAFVWLTMIIFILIQILLTIIITIKNKMSKKESGNEV